MEKLEGRRRAGHPKSRWINAVAADLAAVNWSLCMSILLEAKKVYVVVCIFYTRADR